MYERSAIGLLQRAAIGISVVSLSLNQLAAAECRGHLDPKPQPKKKQPSGPLFSVAESADTETLLANLSETLASANAMLGDLTFDLEGSRRHFALGVQQMIELSELLANRALDIVDPR